MSDRIEKARAILSSCTEEEQRLLLAWLRERHPVHPLEAEFGAPAEVILEAISRASDLSRRGVLGLIAEASFQVNVVDRLRDWSAEKVAGDHPFDFRLRKGESLVTVQVKRQRLQAGRPKLHPGGGLYVVETQRTRSGIDRTTGESTRQYRFGDFDVLAVCMQPSTGSWTEFRYAVQRCLLPFEGRPSCLKVLQPVSLTPNEDWADSLEEAVRRHRSGIARKIQG